MGLFDDKSKEELEAIAAEEAEEARIAQEKADAEAAEAAAAKKAAEEALAKKVAEEANTTIQTPTVSDQELENKWKAYLRKMGYGYRQRPANWGK